MKISEFKEMVWEKYQGLLKDKIEGLKYEGYTGNITFSIYVKINGEDYLIDLDRLNWHLGIDDFLQNYNGKPIRNISELFNKNTAKYILGTLRGELIFVQGVFITTIIGRVLYRLEDNMDSIYKELGNLIEKEVESINKLQYMETNHEDLQLMMEREFYNYAVENTKLTIEDISEIYKKGLLNNLISYRIKPEGNIISIEIQSNLGLGYTKTIGIQDLITNRVNEYNGVLSLKESEGRDLTEYKINLIVYAGCQNIYKRIDNGGEYIKSLFNEFVYNYVRYYKIGQTPKMSKYNDVDKKIII